MKEANEEDLSITEKVSSITTSDTPALERDGMPSAELVMSGSVTSAINTRTRQKLQSFTGGSLGCELVRSPTSMVALISVNVDDIDQEMIDSETRMDVQTPETRTDDQPLQQQLQLMVGHQIATRSVTGRLAKKSKKDTSPPQSPPRKFGESHFPT